MKCDTSFIRMLKLFDDELNMYSKYEKWWKLFKLSRKNENYIFIIDYDNSYCDSENDKLPGSVTVNKVHSNDVENASKYLLDFYLKLTVNDEMEDHSKSSLNKI